MTFSLTILGSSSALPTSNRTVTAHVLNVHERFFLIDCGEGTQMQMRRYRIRFSKIHHIFISHLHGDHFYGLFGLLSSLNLIGRKVPMHIYGPPDLQKFLDLHFGVSADHLDFPLVFIPHNMREKSLILEDKHMTVESFPLDHKIECVGFLFREKKGERRMKKDVIEDLGLGIREILTLKQGRDYVDEKGVVHPNNKLTIAALKPRSYAYCSDTRYKESIIPFIRATDLLYHEATYMEDMKDRAIITGHSTAREAALIAEKSNAGKLIIGHFSSRYKDLNPLLEEARSIFPETFLAEEGMCYEASRSKGSD